MTHFEEMLLPLGGRVVGKHLNSSDVNERTVIQLLDRQPVLCTNVLYLGPARAAEGILDGSMQVEPGCFILLSGCTQPALSQSPVTAKAAVVEVHSSLAALYNHVSNFLNNRQTAAPESGEAPLERFWDDVLEQKLTIDAAIREALVALFPHPKTFFRVMLVRFERDAGPDEYHGLMNELQEFLPDSCISRYHDEIVILYFHEKRVLQLPLNAEECARLEQILQRYGAHAAVGHGSRHYDKLRTAYLLCGRVLTLAGALRLRDEGRLHQYDRYSMYNVIDLAAQRFTKVYGHSDIIYLVHPAIVELTRHDMKHRTDLRDTLYYYLINDRNLLRTAKATYVHRNTVVNKVNKITELTGVDLTDGGLCQRLIFSCQLIQYYERVLHLSLKL